ncbi:Hypothetical protein NocV09_08800010, partial [Nannochloropsis oceanica]
SHPSFLL